MRRSKSKYQIRLWGLVLPLLLIAGNAAAACLTEDFESALAGWTWDGLWHRVSTATACGRAQSGTGSFYFGRDIACDYNDGQIKDACLYTPAFTVGPATDALSFWYLFEIESKNPKCYDQMRVEVSNNNGPWALLLNLGPSSDPAGGGASLKVSSGGGLGNDGQWMYAQASLAAYVGASIQVRFRFMDGAGGLKAGCGVPDAEFDNFLGFYVDNVRLGCALADAVLAKSAAPAYAANNDTVTFTLAYTNNSPTAQDLSLWDTLPLGAVFLTSSAQASLSGSLVSWTLSAVPASSLASVIFSVSVGPGLVYPLDWLNQAGVSLAGGSPFISNFAQVKIRQPALSIRKVARPASLNQGDMLSYDLVVTNESASVSGPLLIQDSLPSGFTFQQSSLPGDLEGRVWTYGPAGYLNPGASMAITLDGVYQGPPGLVHNEVYANTPLGWARAGADVQAGAQNGEVPRLRWVAVYPNPAPSGKEGFKKQAYVVYELGQPAHLKLSIYTAAGELVRELERDSGAGKGQVAWDLKNSSGAPVSFGVYMLRLKALSRIGLDETVNGNLAVVW